MWGTQDERRFTRGFGRGKCGRRRGEGGWGGCPFGHGDLRFLILHLISEKPRHGYEVIKAIEEIAGGAYSPSPGVVYPTLTMLEELGYVSVAAADGGKKLYSVTPEGTAVIAQSREQVAAILGRAAEAGRIGEVPPQILRAAYELARCVAVTNWPWGTGRGTRARHCCCHRYCRRRG